MSRVLMRLALLVVGIGEFIADLAIQINLQGE
jgi:hypothetical protein